ncbi:MAG: sodium:solute symporter [Bacteroidia bacterium]|nr:sodium:solute symporter [Bacteroidia bacterium]
MSSWDYLVVGLYFALTFVIAYWVTVRERNKSSTRDYFLANRDAGWFLIGASLFASNIGAEHIIGLAGSGARGDMPAGQFEILASFMLILLGWLFVPFYLKSGVFTMPEFLERRYSRSARVYLSVVSIIAYVLTKISLTIFAGALVFEVLGVPFWTGALIVVIFTGVYTVFGGFKAVLYTDMVQLFVLLGGMLVVTLVPLQMLGGWSGLMASVQAAGAQDPTLHAADFFNLWRPAADTRYPWTGLMFGAPILGIWYWCTDQFIVQRVLSAPNVSEGRRGALFAGYLKQLPLFIFLVPGILAFALSRQGLMPTLSDPDKALPLLISEILPTGLKGLVIAGLLAALMSSLSSAFNSCSTLFTIDFYARYRPQASERELVWTGQLATGVLVAISLAYIPLMKTLTEGGGIIQYMQSVQAYISPPIAAAFLLGLFFRRINSRGAILSLWTGFVIGVLRLVGEFMVKNGQLQPAPGSWTEHFIGMNFLHFAFWLFVLSALILVTGSRLGPQQPPDTLQGLIYNRSERGFFESNRTDVLLTLVLAGIVVAVWVIFSPAGIGR